MKIVFGEDECSLEIPKDDIFPLSQREELARHFIKSAIDFILKSGKPPFEPRVVSLRDYFAGMAMAEKAATNGHQLGKERKWLAEDAYRIADAMLTERDKEA